MKIFPLCLYKDMHININTHYTHIYKHISTYIYIIHIHFTYTIVYVTSVQFSCTAVSNSLQPHGLQHPRPPCPSPTPRLYSNSCPSSQWCHPTISSSVVPFFPPSIFPSIRVFPNESALCIRWPKYWSFSFSISPSNEHSGLISFRMDWLISLHSKGLSTVFSNTIVQKHQFFSAQLSSQSNSYIHTWPLEKP